MSLALETHTRKYMARGDQCRANNSVCHEYVVWTADPERLSRTSQNRFLQFRVRDDTVFLKTERRDAVPLQQLRIHAHEDAVDGELTGVHVTTDLAHDEI